MLGGFNKFQRHAVHTITQAGRFGTIIENVTEMRVTAIAQNFHPRFSETVINFFLNIYLP